MDTLYCVQKSIFQSVYFCKADLSKVDLFRAYFFELYLLWCLASDSPGHINLGPFVQVPVLLKHLCHEILAIPLYNVFFLNDQIL